MSVTRLAKEKRSGWWKVLICLYVQEMFCTKFCTVPTLLYSPPVIKSTRLGLDVTKYVVRQLVYNLGYFTIHRLQFPPCHDKAARQKNKS